MRRIFLEIQFHLWRKRGSRVLLGVLGGGWRRGENREENIRDSRRTAWWLNFAKTVKWLAMNLLESKEHPCQFAFLLCFWKPNILQGFVMPFQFRPFHIRSPNFPLNSNQRQKELAQFYSTLYVSETAKCF